MIRAFASMGAAISDDTPPTGGATGGGKPAEAAHLCSPLTRRRSDFHAPSVAAFTSAATPIETLAHLKGKSLQWLLYGSLYPTLVDAY